ncbi:MAG TPA: S-layer protein [Candidatus Woesearchaeota archaeon]|nr:S-layer protein [Candidatus Woesearchaeota archaeon]
MYVVKKEKETIKTLETSIIDLKGANVIGSKISMDILSLTSNESLNVSQLSQKLKVSEQKIYYYIHKMAISRLVKVVKTQKVNGSLQKYYQATSASFLIPFGEFKKTNDVSFQNKSEYLEPFVLNGKLNAKIIVGSPEPHGPEKARSRDGYYGIDFALFLGTFLNFVPQPIVMLDTETRESDLKSNLIIIGGPIVNKVCEIFNSSLPINFQRKEGLSVYSKLSNKVYYDDETGIIVKENNPFSKGHKILILAGKRFSGTKSAILAFLKHFNEIKKGNIYDPRVLAKVVIGVDLNSDGFVDDCEIAE